MSSHISVYQNRLKRIVADIDALFEDATVPAGTTVADLAKVRDHITELLGSIAKTQEYTDTRERIRGRNGLYRPTRNSSAARS